MVSSDLRTTLVFIWAKILALDGSCQVGLCVGGAHGGVVGAEDRVLVVGAGKK